MDTVDKQFIYEVCRNAPDQTLLLLTRNHFEWAQAFWQQGEHREKRHIVDMRGRSFDTNISCTIPDCWRKHLQEIVLEEDPIIYLKKFIPALSKDD